MSTLQVGVYVALAALGGAAVGGVATFATTRAAAEAQVTLTCPEPAPALPHSMPMGVVPPTTGYKTW